jgi:hypothetical protein
MHIQFPDYAYLVPTLCIFSSQTMHIQFADYAYSVHRLRIFSAQTMHIQFPDYAYLVHRLCIFSSQFVSICSAIRCVFYREVFKLNSIGRPAQSWKYAFGTHEHNVIAGKWNHSSGLDGNMTRKTLVVCVCVCARACLS